MEGLQRPEPLEWQQEQGTPSLVPAVVKPSQVTVPSTPKVPPVKPVGPLLVPALAADRPIPASLLQTELGAPPQPVQSEVPVSAPAESIRKVPVQAAPAPEPAPEPAPKSAPEAEPEALFDSATEARILSLRAGREITLDRIERVMAGFKLRPKPVVKPKPAKKAAAKAADGADKKADKKAYKKSKGH